MWGGLDLAASPQRPSALAVGGRWDTLRVETVFGDEAIIARLQEVPIVWVDAPLTASESAFRDCDRALHAVGIMPLPLTWRSMQALHRRAVALRKMTPSVEWRETFPWSVYLWLGARRSQKKDPALLAAWARANGFTGEPASVHEWDAVACWALGWLNQMGASQCIQGEEGAVWIPAQK